jgi:uncharacterized protein with ATP-grasp and redox domains
MDTIQFGKCQDAIECAKMLINHDDFKKYKNDINKLAEDLIKQSKRPIPQPEWGNLVTVYDNGRFKRFTCYDDGLHSFGEETVPFESVKDKVVEIANLYADEINHCSHYYIIWKKFK